MPLLLRSRTRRRRKRGISPVESYLATPEHTAVSNGWAPLHGHTEIVRVAAKDVSIAGHTPLKFLRRIVLCVRRNGNAFPRSGQRAGSSNVVVDRCTRGVWQRQHVFGDQLNILSLLPDDVEARSKNDK